MRHTDTSQDDTGQPTLPRALTSAAVIAAIIACLYGLSLGAHWVHRAF
jgi:hypothetical protein